MYNLNCNTYEAVEIYSPENTVIRMGRGTKMVHNNRLRHFRGENDL